MDTGVWIITILASGIVGFMIIMLIIFLVMGFIDYLVERKLNKPYNYKKWTLSEHEWYRRTGERPKRITYWDCVFENVNSAIGASLGM